MKMTLERQPQTQEQDLSELRPAGQIQALSEKYDLSADEQDQFIQIATEATLNGVDSAVRGRKFSPNLISALQEFSSIGKNEKRVESTLETNSSADFADELTKKDELATKENLDLRSEYDQLSLFILQSELSMEDKMSAIQGFARQLRDITEEFGGFTFDNVKTALSNLSTDAEMPIQREFAGKVWDFVRSNSETMSRMNEEELQQFMMSSLG